jgi:hypothetical protein
MVVFLEGSGIRTIQRRNVSWIWSGEVNIQSDERRRLKFSTLLEMGVLSRSRVRSADQIVFMVTMTTIPNR